jgi:beta-lactamase class A
LSGIRPQAARVRKARQAQNKARSLALPLTALAVAFVPGIHGERVDALPSSVVGTVAQIDAQPQLAPQVLAPASSSEASARRVLDARLRSLGQSFNGDVGIAVKDLQTGFTSHYDGNSHFPQQSVSKFWVTLTALDKADRGELGINSPVTVRKSDLTLFNQPIAQQIGANGYTTTLSELMQRAMQQSDNTCNDFVLWRSGGPEAVKDFLYRKGITGVRFGPGERVMQSRIAGMEWRSSMVGSAFYAARNAVPASVRRAAFENYVSNPVDGATPLGVVDALARLKKGELLSPASTDKLLRIMSNTRTGPKRLKGGLASGWSLAHKTGTGQVLGSTHSGYNDIGIITGPDGRSYSLAVFIRRTSAPIPTRMALMQNVTRAVIDYSRNAQIYNLNIAHGYPSRADSGSGSN